MDGRGLTLKWQGEEGSTFAYRVVRGRHKTSVNKQHSLHNSAPKGSRRCSWTAWPLNIRNTGCAQTPVITKLRCVIRSQKKDDLIYKHENSQTPVGLQQVMNLEQMEHKMNVYNSLHIHSAGDSSDTSICVYWQQDSQCR